MSQKDLFQKKLNDIKAILPEGASLLIVSKTRSVDEIKVYYELGHRDFGENRVQELSEKAQALKESCPEIRWHMIGHLQSNKVKNLFQVPHLHAIHSVHDLNLVEKLVKSEEHLTHPVEIFLQFNTSKEEEKSGFEDEASLREAAELLLHSQKLNLRGLMTMGTLRTENFEAEAARCFRELQKVKENLQVDLHRELKTSMGMSQDYKIALAEKSDWIRLGTMMFT